VDINTFSTAALAAELERRRRQEAAEIRQAMQAERLRNARQDESRRQRAAAEKAVRDIIWQREQQAAHEAKLAELDALDTYRNAQAWREGLADQWGERASILSLARDMGFTMFQDATDDYDGTSHVEDMDKQVPWDQRAIDFEVGDPFKMQVAICLNRSQRVTYGTGDDYRAHENWRKAQYSGKWYKQTLTLRDFHIGDNHQLDAGDRGIVALAVPDSLGDTDDVVRIYAVEWEKLWLDLTNPAKQRMWLRINYGRPLPSYKTAFVYEPTRFILVGTIPNDMGMSASAPDYGEVTHSVEYEEVVLPTGETHIIEHEVMSVEHKDVFDMAHAAEAIGSVRDYTVADNALDIAYWWFQEQRIMADAIEDGHTEGFVIPGARKDDTAFSMQRATITEYAKSHGWTTGDLDGWMRKRGLKADAPKNAHLRALRASLPAEVLK
jgi:hypothetical protein